MNISETERQLISIIADFAAIHNVDCNFSAGLANRIRQTGKEIDDLTIGEFSAISQRYSDDFNGISAWEKDEEFPAMNNKPEPSYVRLTGFEHILDIGAAVSEAKYNKNLGCYSLPLDDAELESLESKLEDSCCSVLSAVAAIGSLLAYTNTNELGSQRINEIGFAVHGLAELSDQLRQKDINVAHELMQREKANGRIPKKSP